MQYAIDSLSPGFTPGIAMALAGSHFIYIKEIPIGMEYTMETRVIGWGDKWYVPNQDRSISRGMQSDEADIQVLSRHRVHHVSEKVCQII